MKQIELAKLCNVSKSTVSMWCSGSSSPNLSMLIKLASVLECEITDLIETTKKTKNGNKKI